jgi:archaellum component FlaC
MPRKSAEEQIEELAITVGKGFQAMDLRFEVIDRRFEEIDRRFDVIDVRFNAIDRRFDGIEERLERLEFLGSSQDRRLSVLEDRE